MVYVYNKGLISRIFQQKLRFLKEDGSSYSKWEEKRLGDVLEYEQPTKYLVANSEYTGTRYPVLTANKGFILGYTDEEEGVYNKGEVIIFDDFTRDSKFVDFEFKVKSSAIKLLTTAEKNNNTRYLYAYLKKLNPKPLGHQRHWISLVQDEYIDLPCPEEQQKIADFLTSWDEILHFERDYLEKLKLIKKGLLQQMFV